MTIYFSQVIILICVVFFLLSHLISVYFFKGLFYTSKIRLQQPLIAWKILQNTSLYNRWWSKFKNVPNVNPYINISRNLNDNFMLKMELQNLYPKFIDEEWTFYIRQKNNKYYLVIKKETLAYSSHKIFLNKYYKDYIDFRKFKKDFTKIYKTIYTNLESTDYLINN